MSASNAKYITFKVCVYSDVGEMNTEYNFPFFVTTWPCVKNGLINLLCELEEVGADVDTGMLP